MMDRDISQMIIQYSDNIDDEYLARDHKTVQRPISHDRRY